MMIRSSGRAPAAGRESRGGAARPQALAVLLLTLWLTVSAAAVAGCGHSAAAPHVPAKRILFIGNSFTYYNGGIDAQLKGLAPTATTGAVTAGGATLQQHWNAGTAVGDIRSGHWDYVVLQEQSQTPVIAAQLFARYAGAFDTEIRAAGGKTVLLMTWQRPDSVQYKVTTAYLAAVYTQTGAAIGAAVAPAGLAFATALRERPDLVLNNADGHPTPAGTYLAACVLYGTIYGRSPVGNPFGPASSGDRTFLQEVAARTLGL
ncbi:MAG: hypothetical protein WCN81_00470 [Actinomycetes bacterium]